MVSNARDDLPEPDKPVITTSWSRGRSTSMFLRLWTRAPRTAIQSLAMCDRRLFSAAAKRTILARRVDQLARGRGLVWARALDVLVRCAGANGCAGSHRENTAPGRSPATIRTVAR